MFGYRNRFDEKTCNLLFSTRLKNNIKANICSDLIFTGLSQSSAKFKNCLIKHLEILDFARLGVFTPNDFHTLLCLTNMFKVIHDGDLMGNTN